MPDSLISLRQLRTMIPFSAMHIWRLERDGRFPRRIKVGASRVAWSLKEVQDWIEARKADRFVVNGAANDRS
jgi:prophage regulatory protein